MVTYPFLIKSGSVVYTGRETRGAKDVEFEQLQHIRKKFTQTLRESNYIKLQQKRRKIKQ